MANQGGYCKCESCGSRFTGLSAFDMHRTGEYAKRARRRCLTTAEMRASGMGQTDDGLWNTGRKMDPDTFAAKPVAPLAPVAAKAGAVNAVSSVTRSRGSGRGLLARLVTRGA